MSASQRIIDESMIDYLHSLTNRESPSAIALREKTRQHQFGGMLTSPEQMQLITLLIKSIRAQHILEIGTFTGYSAKKWYLLADPQDLPTIEVAFLDGRRQPMIESAEPTPDYLGVTYQAVFDFGCALQEPKGGIAMKGEN